MQRYHHPTAWEKATSSDLEERVAQISVAGHWCRRKAPKWQGARGMLGGWSLCPLIGGPGHRRNISSSAHYYHSACVKHRESAVFAFSLLRVFFVCPQCLWPKPGCPLSSILFLDCMGKISRCPQSLKRLRIEVVLLASFKQGAYRAYETTVLYHLLRTV